MSAINMQFIGVFELTGLIAISVDATRAQEPEEAPQAMETIEVVGSHIHA